MATPAQKRAARKNIRKAQKKWQSMSSRQRARSQPEGRSRSRPGSSGEGKFFHIQVRPKEDFRTFRVQDVGRKGHVERLAGKRQSGGWSTVKWMISKEDAHRDGETLAGDTAAARKLLRRLGSKPRHTRGDLFEARPRPNVPEKSKPTAAQKKARKQNIRKARKAWQEMHTGSKAA